MQYFVLILLLIELILLLI